MSAPMPRTVNRLAAEAEGMCRETLRALAGGCREKHDVDLEAFWQSSAAR